MVIYTRVLASWDISPSYSRVPAQAGFNRGFPMLCVKTCSLPILSKEGLWKHVHMCGMLDLVNILSPLCHVQKGPSLYCYEAAMADNSQRSRFQEEMAQQRKDLAWLLQG